MNTILAATSIISALAGAVSAVPVVIKALKRKR